MLNPFDTAAFRLIQDRFLNAPWKHVNLTNDQIDDHHEIYEDDEGTFIGHEQEMHELDDVLEDLDREMVEIDLNMRLDRLEMDRESAEMEENAREERFDQAEQRVETALERPFHEWLKMTDWHVSGIAADMDTMAVLLYGATQLKLSPESMEHSRYRLELSVGAFNAIKEERSRELKMNPPKPSFDELIAGSVNAESASTRWPFLM